MFRLVTAAVNVQSQNSRASSASSYLEHGAQAMAKAEWDLAIANYDIAIAVDTSAVAYYNRGVARHRKGDPNGAFNDYNRAIELNPRYADAYLNRRAIFFRKG